MEERRREWQAGARKPFTTHTSITHVTQARTHRYGETEAMVRGDQDTQSVSQEVRKGKKESMTVPLVLVMRDCMACVCLARAVLSQADGREQMDPLTLFPEFWKEEGDGSGVEERSRSLV